MPFNATESPRRWPPRWSTMACRMRLTPSTRGDARNGSKPTDPTRLLRPPGSSGNTEHLAGDHPRQGLEQSVPSLWSIAAWVDESLRPRDPELVDEWPPIRAVRARGRRVRVSGSRTSQFPSDEPGTIPRSQSFESRPTFARFPVPTGIRQRRWVEGERVPSCERCLGVV
jgi:hypothetical protein